MGTKQEVGPLVVIVGQTASGKSELALKLAKQFNAEIISGDSRTIYKGMDIGTAKPSKQDQAEVRHHLIDLTTPDKPLTASDYKRLALGAIKDVSSRGKLPILVGGSGLYIDSVIFDFQFNNGADRVLREELDKLSVDELQERIKQKGLKLPTNEKNKRYLIRRLEAGTDVQKRGKLRKNTLIIGLRLDNTELKDRIQARVRGMMSEGLAKEVTALSKSYGWDIEPLRTIGYREFHDNLAGKADLVETEKAIVNGTVRYSKRQNTWFKRNKDIHWIEKQIQAVDLVTTFLNK